MLSTSKYFNKNIKIKDILLYKLIRMAFKKIIILWYYLTPRVYYLSRFS